MARAIGIDGRDELVFPENGINFSIQETQGHTDSVHFEQVVLDEDHEMWVDKGGKSNNKPINTVANRVYHFFHPFGSDHIVGDALICRRGEVQ